MSTSIDTALLSEAVALDKEIQALSDNPSPEQVRDLRKRLQGRSDLRDALRDLRELRSDPGSVRGWEPGDEIQGYTLVKIVGRGSFGEVWLAVKISDLTVSRFALKVLCADASQLARIKREVRLQQKAGELPNVLPVIEAFLEDGYAILVTRYIQGGSLADLLRAHEGRGLPLGKVLSLLESMAQGLANVQRHKIVHRDLKPANILLPGEEGDNAVIADFGLARDLSEENSEHRAGTQFYMPPEYLSGEAEASEQNDHWALGIIGYEISTGKRPYDSPPHSYRPPPRLPESVPQPLRDILTKLLAEHVSERYASAEALRRDVSDARRQIQHENPGALDDGRDLDLEEASDRILGRRRGSWRQWASRERLRALRPAVLVLAGLAMVKCAYAWVQPPARPVGLVAPVPIRGTNFDYPMEPRLTPEAPDATLRNVIVTDLNEAISGCQGASFYQNEAAYGDLRLRFTIQENGGVSGIHAEGDDALSETLLACAVRLTRNQNFPVPAAGRTSVDVTFHLYAPPSVPRMLPPRA